MAHDLEDVYELAELVGFSHWGELNVASLDFRAEVRDMCAADKCGKYGKSWSCPPYCGTLEEIAARASKYNCGVLLQTTGNMEDDFDYECIKETGALHKAHFADFLNWLKSLYPDNMPMDAGTCNVCKECTCPDAPCRFPDKAVSSMEACGLVVSDVCSASGVSYYYGEKTITYTSCVLFNY